VGCETCRSREAPARRWIAAAALSQLGLLVLAAPANAEQQPAKVEGGAPAQPADAASSAAPRCPPQAPVEARRRSATVPVLEYEPTPCNPQALPAPDTGALGELQGIPDRWRIVDTLGYRRNLLDPYHGNNWLKGDRPAFGEDWFVSLIGISDTLFEPRRFPVPVGGPASARPGSLDTFGEGEQLVLAQAFVFETALYQGDTVFKPPDWEFRFTPALAVTHVEVEERGLLKANPDFGASRTEAVLGVQALFVDKHLRNVSEHYDFDSLRVGVQPFTSDFRGFLFLDAPFGVRLFGTRANNRYQYNLGWFRRIEKDTNSGLNNLLERGAASLRDDDVLVANVYRQDTVRPGLTLQATLVYNRNREGGEVFYDDNGVIQRPASIGLERGGDYDVVYAGLSADGHWERWNVSASAYGAFGESDRGLFVEREQDVRAGFFAAELSRDFSWIRARVSVAYASADENPFDDRAGGFDAIFENPLFAGADTSFWIREPVPLIGGGRVALSGRNGMLNSLRSSKEHGQSSFTNPGLLLVGVGADLDLTPQLRVSGNASYLAFADSTVLEVARAQAPIDEPIGLDLSLALTWRPFATQNVVARLSAAALIPGSGYRDLFGDELAYAVLGNLLLTY
jgi:hypothetical protein